MTTQPGERRLRVGVVGLGTASSLMLPALAQDPRVSIVAGCDTDGEALEVFVREFQVKPYWTLEQFCADPDIDVAYIATPHLMHGEHAVVAAEHGKHVVVEKPMALTLADCDRMIAAAENSSVQLFIGYSHALSPAIQKMGEIIAGGELGRVRMINTWNYNDWLYRYRPLHDLDERLGGGAVFNQVVHQIDMVRTLAGGMVQSVRAATGAWDPDRPTPANSLVFLEFDNGVVASMVHSGYDRFDVAELNFSRGESGERRKRGPGAARRMLGQVKDHADEVRHRVANRANEYRRALAPRREDEDPLPQPHYGVIIAGCERGDMRPSEDGVIVYGDDGRREIALPPSYRVPGRAEFVDEIYGAVVGSRPAVYDGHWGRASVEVCLAILESSRTHREVRLPLEGP